MGKLVPLGILTKKPPLQTLPKVVKWMVVHRYTRAFKTYDFWFVMNLVDKYGNESQDKVLSFDYDDNDIDKINWDNMYTDKFMELANNEWIHPALR